MRQVKYQSEYNPDVISEKRNGAALQVVTESYLTKSHLLKNERSFANFS